MAVASGCHRLFVGCPLPSGIAAEVHRWAAGAGLGPEARLVPAERLHVTLLFYPSVSDADLPFLSGLVRETVWAPIGVASGPVERFSMSALALVLKPDEEVERALLDRMGGRVSPDDPLCQLVCRLGDAEMERFRRTLRRGMRWHVTIARLAPGGSVTSPPQPPKWSFALDRLVLFESRLGAGGSRYTPLAESG
ncbi:MAG: hypothetical protein H6534_03685 [Chthonomonadaceae bacterium]|nr:hypothetical protein [Chthonomonadaceae bacterium]